MYTDSANQMIDGAITLEIMAQCMKAYKLPFQVKCICDTATVIFILHL